MILYLTSSVRPVSVIFWPLNNTGKYRIKELWISFFKSEYSILRGGAVLMIKRILKSLTLSNVIGIPIIIALLIMLVWVMVNSL